MKISKTLFFLILIILLGLFLRIQGITKESVWIDEIYSIFQSEKNLKEIITCLTSQSVHPPFHFYLLHFWMKLFGQSLFATRLLSAILGTILIITVFILAKEFFDIKTALLTTLFISLNPFHIFQSQEIRMYTLYSLLVTVSVLCFINFLRKNKCYKLYILFSILSLLTHYFTVFILIAENLFILIYYKKYKNIFKKFILSQLIIAGLFCIWLPYFLIQFRNAISDYWMKGTFLSSLWGVFVTFVSNHEWHGFKISIENILALLCIIFVILKILKSRKEERILFLCILLFLPLFLSYGYSLLIKPMFMGKYLIPNSVYFYMLAVAGIFSIKNKKFSYVFLSLLIILQLSSLIKFKSNIYKGPMKTAQDFISKNKKDGDLFYHTSVHTYFPFLYYNRELKDEILLLSTVEIQFYNGRYIIDKSKVKPSFELDRNRRAWIFVCDVQRDTNIDIEKTIKEETKISEYREFREKTSWMYSELYLVLGT